VDTTGHFIHGDNLQETLALKNGGRSNSNDIMSRMVFFWLINAFFLLLCDDGGGGGVVVGKW